MFHDSKYEWLSATEWMFVSLQNSYVEALIAKQWWYLETGKKKKKQSLWEVIRFIWGHESRASIMGLVSLRRDMRKMILLSALWGNSRKAAIYKPGRGFSPERNPAGTLTLDPAASSLQENKFLLFNLPSR